MNQIKTIIQERISSMEGQLADLRDMMKKMLEIQKQMAASIAKGREGKSTNSKICREEDEVEIMEGERRRTHLELVQREERGREYGEHQEGYYGHRGGRTLLLITPIDDRELLIKDTHKIGNGGIMTGPIKIP
ncbi:hypothetical protein MA16_Dca026480 [Dendrobium catenatum]|uniref:Uncharacterized protein n=1 Tax=Dendrobium catenatum TaxID=906689 RepID=A0A2I0V9P8_9ASPA|nr:hypothetical protein MA16_Dca026480 [Dendrobium catenatum]